MWVWQQVPSGVGSGSGVSAGVGISAWLTVTTTAFSFSPTWDHDAHVDRKHLYVYSEDRICARVHRELNSRKCLKYQDQWGIKSQNNVICGVCLSCVYHAQYNMSHCEEDWVSLADWLKFLTHVIREEQVTSFTNESLISCRFKLEVSTVWSSLRWNHGHYWPSQLKKEALALKQKLYWQKQRHIYDNTNLIFSGINQLEP